ncbi:MAG: transposase [Cyclobacteriaceae bacterium]
MKFFKLDQKPLSDTLKADFFITMSLRDVIEADKIQELENHFDLKYNECLGNESALNRLRKAYFLKYDRLLNLSENHQILNQKGIADKIKNVLLEYNGSLYHIMAFTIMPNHIHVLFKLKNPEQNKLQQRLDGVTSLLKEQLNQNLDQYVELGDNLWTGFNCAYHLSQEKEVINLISYIIEDPVKVRLVNYWKDYPYTFINPDHI